ncbi:hypothetical protein [Comamonas testosteroni]|uniref:hypothetical protein n=1 Tax=Comamonas testosteroni TaxID=285 RepID=UPI000AD512EE|nr:hypothetical protein [Comamonas testosteroni]
MQKRNAPPPKPFTPSPQSVRRAVASSTALETRQTVQQLEQKLLSCSLSRSARIKLAD